MSERTLVAHCSPTMAGMKTGNLFSCRYGSCSQLYGFAAKWNAELNPRGVYIRIMRSGRGMALIYVYRKTRLEKDIQDIRVKQFMENCGYDCCDLDGMLDILAARLQKYSEFPHEIGVFLGYPFEDVRAFISNRGRNYKHVGHWKVYSNEPAAIKTFRKFNKCTDMYCRLLDNGAELNRLTVKDNLICP